MRFQPDSEIFKETTEFDYETLQTRLREQAFLNAGVRIVLADERDPENRREDDFMYNGGISSFVEYINKKKAVEVIHPDVIHFSPSRPTTPPPRKSPCSTTTATPNCCFRSPTISTPRTAARTKTDSSAR